MGLEPTTSNLKGNRSNRLSYTSLLYVHVRIFHINMVHKVSRDKTLTKKNIFFFKNLSLEFSFLVSFFVLKISS